MGLVLEDKALEDKDLEAISEKYHLSNIIVFGSVLTDAFHKESDIDIAVIGEEILCLEDILNLEMYFEQKLERAIDVIDLNNEGVDIFLKMNILNTGKSIYANDENKSLQEITDAIEWYYKENETFFFFRRRDLLS